MSQKAAMGRNSMLKQKHLFNRLGRLASLAAVLSLFLLPSVFGETVASNYSKEESALYRDVFDQNVYYEGTQYLHLERLYRRLFGKRKSSLNINVFDEVPNSTFFTNRHGREALSLEELKQGPAKADGPGAGTQWSIAKGKFKGITPGFFVQNQAGEKFLLKFDPIDNFELSTGAEVIASRFLYAIGYNVPEYHLSYFKREQLEIDPSARVYDESGFRKKLTPERLEEFLIYVPQRDDGRYRASASRILKGEILGPMKLQGRQKNDPNDPVNHEDRREIRALQVFNAWLNNHDVRESNTLDVVEEGGTIRHYLIDFNSALGATPRGPKPPMFGHEYMVDYGEGFKAFLGLGFWEKPWQKRWEEAGQAVDSPSLGYFDNRHFKPGRYKTQLPYFPFKDLTRADGFWAAKIMMKFTNEEIETIVSLGEYADKETEKKLAQTLIERRDLIGSYWFKKANPLDEFRFRETNGAYELEFEDLAVRYGFQAAGESTYHIYVVGKKGKRGIRLAGEKVQKTRFKIDSGWLSEYPAIDLLIRTQRPSEKVRSPYVRVEIRSEDGSPRLAAILHQD